MRHWMFCFIPFLFLMGCASEQDHYGVSPDIWQKLTPEQQQLIAAQAQNSPIDQSGASS